MTNAYLEGLQTTLTLFVVTLGGSAILTFILVWLLRYKWLAYVIRIYVYIMRATPLLLQIIFIFYGLPFFNIVFDRWMAAAIAFILNYAAYFAEILRGGIINLDKGQSEVGQVLGLPPLFVFRKIILPQAIINTFPAISNEVLTLIKDTALISVVGLSDLLKVSRSLVNATATFIPFVTVGAIYLIMNAFLSYILAVIEKRLLRKKGIGYVDNSDQFK
ncbi:MAG: amino acid ABC transporter permease [Erysipelotrichaceae bacterium]|nr:amino acid ABC transporter permease [Erysipelotrichaceae bacterium]